MWIEWNDYEPLYERKEKWFSKNENKLFTET